MDPIEGFRIAWRSIRSHKLRSTLTTLGIVVGVGAVVAFMILGSGFQADILGDFEESNDPELLGYTQTQQQGGIMVGDDPVFTDHDVREMGEIGTVEYVAPFGPLRVTQVTHGDATVTGAIQAEATTPDRLRHAEFDRGESFESGEPEVVLNPEVESALGTDVELGDDLTLRTVDGEEIEVEVVGVLNESIQFTSQGPQPRIFLPIDPHYETELVAPSSDDPQRAYPFVRVRADGIDTVEDTREAARSYLVEDSDAAELKADDYEFAVETEADIVGQITDVLDQITAFITGIAAIALIVGSIGIANIMLVSVTERTREIGIMKAVGARKRDIVQLFLTEATILGLIGSALGVGLGIAGGYVGVTALDAPMVYPVEWILIAVVVGIVVGTLAGVYPAWRAARIDPIEALRHE